MNVIFNTLNISIESIDQKHSIPKSSYYEAYDVINQLLNTNSALCKKTEFDEYNVETHHFRITF